MEYSELNAMIGSLESALARDNPQKGYWRELWDLVKQINEGFRSTRYPTREQRDEAKARCEKLVQAAKKRSDETKARFEEQRKEWEKRQEDSARVKSTIHSRASAAAPLDSIGQGIWELITLPLQLIDRIISDLTGTEPYFGLNEIHSDLLRCNDRLKDGWRVFKEHKDRMLPSDRRDAWEALMKAKERLDEAWRRWKEAKGIARERKQQEWRDRQAEREQKHQDFVARVQANIQKLEGKLEKANAALEHARSHLEELREKYESAWSDSFKERCSEWISEEEERLESIKESIERMEGWMEEERTKIR